MRLDEKIGYSAWMGARFVSVPIELAKDISNALASRQAASFETTRGGNVDR